MRTSAIIGATCVAVLLCNDNMTVADYIERFGVDQVCNLRITTRVIDDAELSPNASDVFRIRFAGQTYDSSGDWLLTLNNNDVEQFLAILPDGSNISYANGALTTPGCTSNATIRMSRHVYRPGDANINGLFDSQDIVAIMQSGKYEDESPATWHEGDFTGNEVFTSEDFVHAFTSGRFRAPRSTTAVPEPTSCLMLLAGSHFVFFRAGGRQ